MSNNDNVDSNETGNNVEEVSNDDKNLDDCRDEGQGKDVPSSPLNQEKPQNLDENVGLGSDEKDDVMEDADKCKDVASDIVIEKEDREEREEEKEEEEKNARRSGEHVADGVDTVMADAKIVEVENGNQDSVVEVKNGNQDSVEVIVSVKDASVGGILTSSSGMANDGEEAKLDSKDNGSVDAKEVNSTANEGGDVSISNQKFSLAKSEDGQKGDELNDNTLEAKPSASGNETDSNFKPLKTKAEDDEKGHDLKNEVTEMDLSLQLDVKKESATPKSDLEHKTEMKTLNNSFLLDSSAEGYESGTEEEQASFLKDVERFYRENNLEFKAPKFYKEELNLLKLWRAVIKLGGYEQVTFCKLWRQVGESFKPPKTCTTVSWTFRIFYEKALLEYENGKLRNGELPFSDGTVPETIRDENQASGSPALGSGRARRDAAARAMQGWHSQRLLANGQVSQPIVKDKNLSSTPKVDKQQKTNGLLKRKKPSSVERTLSVSHVKTIKQQGDTMVIDIGPPADWVKINVQRTNDCFEVYALVPGLLREEVHVQSDPAGRLIISGQPGQLDNPWGVTPFKKVVSLPSRIDPHQTSAVVTLHGQLFVRVPFEQSDV